MDTEDACPRPRPAAFPGLALFRRAWRFVSLRRRSVSLESALLGMDDRLLRDIGVGEGARYRERFLQGADPEAYLRR